MSNSCWFPRAPTKAENNHATAAAPDFTEQYKEENLNDKQRQEIKQTGKLSFYSQYFDEPLTITKKLIDEGNKSLVLKGNIKIRSSKMFPTNRIQTLLSRLETHQQKLEQ